MLAELGAEVQAEVRTRLGYSGTDQADRQKRGIV
jgi:hypothetical protein